MSTLLVFVAISAFSGAIGAEFFGWLMPLARWLIRLGVRQLPTEHRDRYREEWIGDIERKAEGRNLTALAWAFGTWVTARGLARTLGSSAHQQPKKSRRARLIAWLMRRAARERDLIERVYQVKVTKRFVAGSVVAMEIPGIAMYVETQVLAYPWLVPLATAVVYYAGVAAVAGVRLWYVWEHRKI